MTRSSACSDGRGLSRIQISLVFSGESLAVCLERRVGLEEGTELSAAICVRVRDQTGVHGAVPEVGRRHPVANEPAALIKARLDDGHDVRQSLLEDLLDGSVLGSFIRSEGGTRKIIENFIVEIAKHVDLVLLLNVERVVTVLHSEETHE